MAARIAQELRRLVTNDRSTRLSTSEIDIIAQRVTEAGTICSLTLRRAIEKAAPRAAVSDDFVENAAGSLQAAVMLR